MSEKYIVKYYYDGRKIYLQEFEGMFNIVPIWGILQFVSFIGSHVGPFKKFFKGLGVGIGALFTLGTFYKTVDSYIYKIKVANGLLGFIKLFRSFLIKSPAEIYNEVEVEKFEKHFEEELEEELNEELEEKKPEEKRKKIEKFLLEQNAIVSNIFGFLKGILGKFFSMVKFIPFQRVRNIIEGFLNAAKSVLNRDSANRELLEFRFLRKIFSFLKKLFIVLLGFIILALVFVLIFFLLFHVIGGKNGPLGRLLANLLGRTDKEATNVNNKDIKEMDKEMKNIQKGTPEGGIIDPQIAKEASKFAHSFKDLIATIGKGVKGAVGKLFEKGTQTQQLQEAQEVSASPTNTVQAVSIFQKVAKQLKNIVDATFELFKRFRSKVATQKTDRLTLINI